MLRPIHIPLPLLCTHEPGGERGPERYSDAKRAAQLGAGLPHLPVEWSRQDSSLPLGLGEQTMRVFFSEIIRIPNGTAGGELELTELVSRTNTDPHAETTPPGPAPQSSFLVEMKLRYPSWPLGGTVRPCTWLHALLWTATEKHA